MIRSDYERLETLYDASQASLPIASAMPALADAVHFGTNRHRPVHRWFHFKEGFSANLLHALGIDTRAMNVPDSIFLDPFCGSGTTLLAGDLEHRWAGHRVGLEINPFIGFVADTKVGWRKYSGDRFAQLAEEVLASPLTVGADQVIVPGLSTFHNPDIFDPSRLKELLNAVHRVKAVDLPEQAPLLLGIAAATERIGYFRRDGRALRILRGTSDASDRIGLTVADALRTTWYMIAQDLEILEPRRNDRLATFGRVIIDDGRALTSPALSAFRGEVELIAYSPPYLNHIDYTEVYKVESWLLGLIKSQSEMLAQRRRTLRSHASIGISPSSPPLPKDVEEAVLLASDMIINHGSAWHRSFQRLTFAYLEDMHLSLQQQFSFLRAGGRAICVVANSAHGAKDYRVPVAVDIWIARLAEAAGFHVERFAVARQLARRNHINRFLRETAIVLRRPEVS